MSKFRAEVTGIRETRWSSNGLTYETEQEAKEWLDGLSLRWFGYDMGRVVPVDTPEREELNKETQVIYQDFRK